MTMENSGHEGPSPQTGDKQPATHAQVPNPSRRRFNRAGVGASAVVLTLASRSVLADVACTTASGFTSANQSSRGTPPICNGITFEKWLTTPDWPIPKNKPFKNYFSPIDGTLEAIGSGQAVGAGNSAAQTRPVLLVDASLFEAMSGNKTPLVVKNLVAALLNSVQLNAYPTLDNVQKIFKEWNLNRTYEVSAGLPKWTEQDIIKYLRATQGEYFPPPKP